MEYRHSDAQSARRRVELLYEKTSATIARFISFNSPKTETEGGGTCRSQMDFEIAPDVIEKGV